MGVAIPQSQTGLKLPPARVTVVLVALNAIAYVITTAENGFITISDRWLFWGAYIPALMTYPSHWYRIFISMFLHANLFHVFFNMLYLYNFGRSVESVIGSKRYLLLYIASGMVAEAFHTAFIPLEGPLSAVVPAIGASGAISGILGAYLLLFPGSRISMYFFYFFFPVSFTWSAAAYLIFWFVTQVLQGYMGGSIGVAVFAHAGGFIGGLALLPYVMDKNRHKLVRMLTATRRYFYYVYFGRRGLGTISKTVLALTILLVMAGGAYSMISAKAIVSSVRVLDFKVDYKFYCYGHMLCDKGIDEEPVVMKIDNGRVRLASPISSDGVRVVFNRLNALDLFYRKAGPGKKILLNKTYIVNVLGIDLRIVLSMQASYDEEGLLREAQGTMFTDVLSCLGTQCKISGNGNYKFEISTMYGGGEKDKELEGIITGLALTSLAFSILALGIVLRKADELAIVI